MLSADCKEFFLLCFHLLLISKRQFCTVVSWLGFLKQVFSESSVFVILAAFNLIISCDFLFFPPSGCLWAAKVQKVRGDRRRWSLSSFPLLQTAEREGQKCLKIKNSWSKDSEDIVMARYLPIVVVVLQLYFSVVMSGHLTTQKLLLLCRFWLL